MLLADLLTKTSALDNFLRNLATLIRFATSIYLSVSSTISSCRISSKISSSVMIPTVS